MTIHINIGSNLGNRLANIQQTIALLFDSDWIKSGSLRKSRIYQSLPWGYSSENKYLNIGVSFETNKNMNPDDIFLSLNGIEALINGANSHRDVVGRYMDRLLDIDIIAAGTLVYASDTVILPHPRMHLRRFVLQPMSELEEGWIHPILNKSIGELLEELSD